jgi:serine/threonine-protein kinase
MGVCPACNAHYDPETTFCPKDGTQVVSDGAQEEGPSLVGQVIADRYRLTKKLGEGGMGEVYEAQHIYIEKRVALKLLRPEIMSNQEAVTRFYQEARSASAIGHDNIVEIDDFGKLPDGRVYLSMEYLEGESLNDALQMPMDLGRALDIVIQVGKGLAAAHAKNIVHRDMKPENVFLVHKDGKETAKILDFGIAKVSGTEGNQHLTRTGTIFGTPHYMSPEQALGKALDHRTDIYSVGVIMYEMFTGTVPFKAESFMGILTQHLTTLPKPPHEQAPERVIPLPVEAVILKAMAKEVNDRYQTMSALLADLEKLQAELKAGVPLSPATVASGAPVFAPMPGSGAQGVSAAMTTPRTAQGLAVPMPPVGFPQAPPPAPGMWAPPGQPLGVPATTPVPVQSGPVAMAPPAAPYGGPAHTAMVPPRAQPKKGKGGLVAVIVIVVVLLGGGGAAAAIFWDDLMGTQPPPKGPIAGPVKGPVKGDVPPAKVPQPVKAPAPQWTAVQITSTPMGASITHEGKEIAKTPAKVRVPPDRLITYVLRLDGHKEYPVVLNPGDTASKHAFMVKAGGEAPKPKAGAPKPKPKPATPAAPKDPYERLK